MKIIEGSIEELIQYMEWVEAHEQSANRWKAFKEEFHPESAKSSPLEDLMAEDANMPMPAPKVKFGHVDQSWSNLRELVYTLYDQGIKAYPMSKILKEEHDIDLSAHQIGGMLSQRNRAGRRNVRIDEEGLQMTKGADKTNQEGNCLGQGESAAKEPVAKPDEMVTTKRENVSKTVSPLTEPDKTIWSMYQKGNMDIDIKYKLDRMGHPMRVADIRRRIDELKVKA